MRKLLREVLEKQGFIVHLAASGEAALGLLKREFFPIILSDIRMLEADGMMVLREAKKQGRSSAVILMTGFGSMEGAIEAIQEGAFDYISKPFQMNELKTVIARAAKHWESIQATANLGQPGGKQGLQNKNPQLSLVTGKAVIGKSPRIVEVFKTLARAALSGSHVLISGESGTGKELVARAIHENGPRKTHAFVTVNCSACSEAQLDQAVVQADKGTLFLDEVVDLSPGLQVKLLRLAGTPRLIAATHHPLEALVARGEFREDLYYFLKVITIDIPPLRERKEDIADLVGYFVGRCAEKSQKVVSHVSDDAMKVLTEYAWPGNIRELEHSIERAVAMSHSQVLFAEDFPAEILRKSEDPLTLVEATSLEDLEKLHIQKVLSEEGYNKSKASERLGIDRATLYRKAGRYGIDLRSPPER